MLEFMTCPKAAEDTQTSKKHRATKLLIVVAMCSAVGLFAGTAYGETRPLQGTHSMSEVVGACVNADGVPFSITGLYGCIKPNCDGKGGECKVECDDEGKCTGTTPIVAGGAVRGTLNPNLSDILGGGPRFQPQQTIQIPAAR